MESLKTQIALGLVSDQALGGICAAIIKTDGVDVFETNKSSEYPYDDNLYDKLQLLYHHLNQVTLPEKAKIEQQLTQFSVDITKDMINSSGQQIDIIGFHGYILAHRPNDLLNLQLADHQYLADSVDIPVVGRFEQADIACGGQGSPLMAIYHMALAQKLSKPVAFINLGDIISLNWVEENGQVQAFDIGVGMDAINNWVFKHARQHTDYNGSLAASGKIDNHVLAAMMRHKFLAKTPPKAADRYTFYEKLENLEALSLVDGAATATSFIAEEIAYSIALYLPFLPPQIILYGAGTKNPSLIRLLRQKLPNIDIQIAEYHNMDSQGLEAQAYAYLAVRRLNHMPTSYPFTTGVPEPIIGGEIFKTKK